MKLPFVVRVPASTSNLGSGFDTVSAALSLYLTLQVEPGRREGVEWVQGKEPTSQFPASGNLVREALQTGLKRFSRVAPRLRIRMHNPIPLQRGLGSSAAAIVAGIRIAEEIAGLSADPQTIFDLGYPLEGHPDNLSASLLGGWVLSRVNGQRMGAERIPSRLNCRFVLAVPETTVSTRQARAILPQSYPLADVTYNLQRCALLVHALHTGRIDLLQEACGDRLHQPYRSRLVAGTEGVLRRADLDPALAESLLAVSISGSGSALVALARAREDEIGEWMVRVLAAAGTQASFRVLDLDTGGARVLADP